METRSGKYTTNCPNCSGGYLNVKIDNDRVAWFCHNCDEGSSEKYDQPEANGELGPVKATYDYVDESGRLLFQALRFEPVNGPKQFRQRASPDQAKWSIKGVRIVPFMLPELLEDLALGHVVFVVEGEKDVLTLRAHGVAATCNPMGAGKWWPEFNAVLRNADVVVCGDNDQPGREHVALVARNLGPVVSRLRVLDLGSIWPDIQASDDISDWFAGGGSVEALWQAVDALPRYANGLDPDPPIAPDDVPPLELAAWQGQTVPERHWQVHQLIPQANVTLLSGEGAIGKSLLMLQLCCATAIGGDWIGYMPDPGHAIYLGAEDDEDELHRRLHDVALSLRTDFVELAKQLLVFSFAGKDAVLATANKSGIVTPTKRYETLMKRVVALQPKLIALDTAADMFAGNENDRSQVRQFIGLLRALAIAGNSAVLLATHPSLTGMASDSGLSGSTAWHNSVRSRLYFKSLGSNGEAVIDGRRVLEMRKSNYGPKTTQIVLEWQAGVFRPVGGTDDIAQAAREQRIDFAFLAILTRYVREGRNVSDRIGPNYAPKRFCDEPEAKADGITSDQFHKCMLRLFVNQKITMEAYGRPSNPHQRMITI